MKASEIRELSVEDIKEKIDEMTLQQEKTLLAHSVSQLENPLQIRYNRRTIARLKTELKNRELKAEKAK